MTPHPFRQALDKRAARKARRAEKVAENAALAGERVLAKTKRKKSKSLSRLKKDLWDEISLLVRSWAKSCRACGGPVQAACHIVPASDGAATKFFLPNLYPGCHRCNDAERHRRGQWVKKHEAIFGTDYVDALYVYSQTFFPIKKWWVLEQTERMRKLRGLRSEVEGTSVSVASPALGGGPSLPASDTVPSNTSATATRGGKA